MSKIAFYFSTFLLVILFSSFGNPSSNPASFPIPSGIDNMLFYIQRTVNANTIIYQLNVDENSKINKTEPIKIFWMKYASDGTRQDLNFIHRNYGYGIEAKLLDEEKQAFSFHFVSHTKRKFYLMKSPKDNKHHVFANVNGRLTIIDNIFIEIDGGTFWVPNVKYAKVKAKDFALQTDVIEIVKP